MISSFACENWERKASSSVFSYEFIFIQKKKTFSIEKKNIERNLIGSVGEDLRISELSHNMFVCSKVVAVYLKIIVLNANWGFCKYF